MPLATRMPFDPNSDALATSSPDTIPAPQRSFVLFSELFTILAAFLIRSGFSVDTAFPEPINSGGSIAMKSGSIFKYFFTSATSLTHTIEIIFNSFNFKETGAIPLFHPKNIKKLNQMEIGTAGNMTRLSTGYTFLNIQEQSRYIRENIESITKTKIFSLDKKYQFLDNIFLKVLKNNPKKMAQIFFKMFNCPSNTVINFLSNKSSIYEDISIISKMPKWIFLKQLF